MIEIIIGFVLGFLTCFGALVARHIVNDSRGL
jgi:hypothetical protein